MLPVARRRENFAACLAYLDVADDIGRRRRAIDGRASIADDDDRGPKPRMPEGHGRGRVNGIQQAPTQGFRDGETAFLREVSVELNHNPLARRTFDGPQRRPWSARRSRPCERELDWN